MIYFIAALATFAIAVAVRVASLYMNMRAAFEDYEHDSEARIVDVRLKLRQERVKNRSNHHSMHALTEEANVLRGKNGAIKATIRANLKKLTGRGYKSKAGALEHSAAFKGICAAVDEPEP